MDIRLKLVFYSLTQWFIFGIIQALRTVLLCELGAPPVQGHFSSGDLERSAISLLLYSLLYICEHLVVIYHDYAGKLKNQDGISAPQNLLPFPHSQYRNGVLPAIRARICYQS